MFKSDQLKQAKNVDTIIGPSVKVEGDFTGEGNVIVEGIVMGNLRTKENLTIKKNAKVQAKIIAKNAHISGEINGNIIIEENLILTSSAKIKGDITTSILTVETGAKINGKISMNNQQKVSQVISKLEANEEILSTKTSLDKKIPEDK